MQYVPKRRRNADIIGRDLPGMSQADRIQADRIGRGLAATPEGNHLVMKRLRQMIGGGKQIIGNIHEVMTSDPRLGAPGAPGAAVVSRDLPTKQKRPVVWHVLDGPNTKHRR